MISHRFDFTFRYGSDMMDSNLEYHMGDLDLLTLVFMMLPNFIKMVYLK